MDIYQQFTLDVDNSLTINKNSSWTDISNYIMFLTLKNGGCNKSSSGSLQLHFPTHWDQDFIISAVVGGYDMPNMNRHEDFSAKSEAELKTIIILKLEEARKMILEEKIMNEKLLDLENEAKKINEEGYLKLNPQEKKILEQLRSESNQIIKRMNKF